MELTSPDHVHISAHLSRVTTLNSICFKHKKLSIIERLTSRTLPQPQQGQSLRITSQCTEASSYQMKIPQFVVTAAFVASGLTLLHTPPSQRLNPGS